MGLRRNLKHERKEIDLRHRDLPNLLAAEVLLFREGALTRIFFGASTARRRNRGLLRDSLELQMMADVVVRISVLQSSQKDSIFPLKDPL